MNKTEFAGLTALDPGEPLSSDGFSFQALNPLITDRLLKLGARTHRHDEHPAINSPIDAPVLTLTPDGSLPANADIAFGYTLVDADGGETLAGPVSLVSTAPPLEAPTDSPLWDTAAVGGHMTAGAYTYALTLTDPNGETTAGPPFFVNVPPGTDTNVVTISGLSDIVDAVPGATGWRLYKASATGQLHFLAAGGASLDEVLDDGMLCADCATVPPTTNTTSIAQGIEVVVPDTVTNQQTGVVGYRVYASVGGSFLSPSYVEQRDDFGAVIAYTHIVVNPGAPPDVSLSFGGAQKIDPDTELLDWHWKRPVATQADLPTPADDGDVRVTEDEGIIYLFSNDAWAPFHAPALNWMPAVSTASLLPEDDNVLGDVRVTLDTRRQYIFIDQWYTLTAPPHEIYSVVGPVPQRGKLKFVNADVTDDALNDMTIVTPQGGGGGLPSQLQMGDAIEWVYGGASVVKIRGERESYDLPWFTDDFEAPLAEWAGDFIRVENVGGFMQPSATHPLDAEQFVFKGNPEQMDVEIAVEQVVFSTLEFNSLGFGINMGQAGIMGAIIQDGDGTIHFDVIYRDDGGIGWLTAATQPIAAGDIEIGDELMVTVRRDGTKFGYYLGNATQANDIIPFTLIDVPAPMLTWYGVPTIFSDITDVDSWKIGAFTATMIGSTFKMIGTVGPNETTFLDSTTDRDWKGGTLGADWQNLGFMMRKTADGAGLEFRGKLQKTAGANPAPDEVMLTLDPSLITPTLDTVALTGDADGQEVGIVGFDEVTNTIRWRAGRTTDPALKSPYVSFDGLRLS